jgi:hypothetical protein
MIIDRSTNPDYKKDHVAITYIGKNGNGWMRIGYTGVSISHIDKDHLNIIGIDLL